MANEDLTLTVGADTDDFDQAMTDMRENLEKVGQDMKEVGETLTAGLTVPLAAVGTAGYMVASDMEKSQGRIQASLGITKSEAEELGEVAEDVWKNAFGENIREAGEAVTTVHKNMQGITGEELKGATEAAFMLRDLFEYDINESTRAGKALMDNFGMTGTKAFDLITVAAQKGGDYSGELLDTISEYSTYFSAMGMQAEDMFNILIQGAQNGAWNLDKVGDAVKEFNIRAKDGSETTAEGFKAIGLDAEAMGAAIAKGGEEGKKAFMATIAALASMKDPVQQGIAGVALFGTQWEDLESTVLTSLNPAVDVLGEVEGAAQNAGESLYDNLGSRATSLWRDFQSSLEPVGLVLIDLAEKVLPPIGNALTGIADSFGSLNPSVQTAIIIFGLFLAALGPFLVILGSLVTSFTTLIPIFTWVGGLFAGLTVPIWPLIAAIGALIAIGVLLYKNWDTVKEYAKSAWQAIVNFIKPIIEDLKKFITDQFGKIKEFWSKYGEDIVKIAKIYWEYVKGTFSVALSAIVTVVKVGWELIKGAIQIAIEAIKFVIKTVLDVIIGIVSAFISILKGDWSGAWEAIKGIVENVFGNIVDFISGLGKTFYNAGKGLIEQIVKGIKDMASKVTDAVSGVAKKIRDFLPFSPAKVGPLSDLDKLDFGGPITDSIKGALPNVQRMMAGLVSLPSINGSNSVLASSSGQPIILEVDGRPFARGMLPHMVNEIKTKTGIKMS